MVPKDSQSGLHMALVRAPSEAPFRSELFSVSQLEHHARTLAATHEVGRAGKEAEDLLGRLGSNARVLAEAYSQVSEAISEGRRITPAAEWLLDNYHLIEEQVRTARRHLPRGYVRELPCLLNSSSPGRPRAYDIAIELISHADGRVDMEGVQAFVTAYQTVTPLMLGELWAIPIMLRLALLENLRRVSVDVTAGQSDRARAGKWADAMIAIAAKEPGKVVLVLADMVREVASPSNAFAAELASRVQARGPSLAIAMSWLEQRLAEHGQTVEQVFQLTSQTQAAAQVSFGNSIGSLRFLGATDWREFVEDTSVIEQALRLDPAGVYPKMDFATRDRYRHVVEEIAKFSPATQAQVAACVLDASRERQAAGDKLGSHVGHFLIGPGRAYVQNTVAARWPLLKRVGALFERLPLLAYLGAILATTAIATSPLVWWGSAHGFDRWTLVVWSLLIALCASQTALALVHWAATILVKPRVLPRLDFSEGVPPEHRAVVAVPALLTDRREVDELLEGLEVRMLANRDANVVFALLTDFRDAPTETADGDAEILERVCAGVNALNDRYAAQASFFLYHRSRRFNPREGVWMGWERKRGKLEQFNNALRGDESGFAVIVGPKPQIIDTKYVIALDADTQLPRDAARLLVGTMAHPLNRPVYDEAAGRVVSGYSVLQPGLGITMPSARRSLYSRLFAGESGIDPYTRAVSDVYQDLFDEGSFVGKGIYDVDALRKALHNRFPENRILSHDLLEGAHARAGLVSDVVLFEDYPHAHAADVSRRSRWIRGDWQITPWLWPRVPSSEPGKRLRNPLSGLSRWKLLDNLRRSLLPIALLSALAIGWLLPGAALVHTLMVVSIFALPGLLTAATELARRPKELPFNYHVLGIARALGRQLLRELFNLAFLPYDAYISLEAITRTGFRVLISHKRLLQWRTARDAQRFAPADVAGTLASLWSLPVTALALAALIMQSNPEALPVANCLLVLWMFAPAASWWTSQPLRLSRPDLSGDDLAFLRKVARRTWRFFETFVGPDDNHLPPDNFQEDPPQGVAHRTSPTNIGMSLLANLAAFDFGYIPGSDVVLRTRQTLATMDRLQRHRGHLYNWYDTKTLEPLRPLYVSTVDSGNLAGHLLTLAAGLREMETQPAYPQERVYEGLATVLDLIGETVAAPSPAFSKALSALQEQLTMPTPSLVAAHEQLRQIVVHASELAQAQPAEAGEAGWWFDALHAQSRRWLAELETLAPWLLLSPSAAPLEMSGLSLLGIARLEPSGADSPALRDALAAAAESATQRLAELRSLGARCSEFAELEYEFLYDDARRLLSIGYNVADHRLDASFYDLLASEARLASYVAIAQGKLPQEHWFSLGRLLTTSAGRQGLLSWSGSMFEYLMPLLVMPTYEQTLLDETYRAVVERQIEYGRERGVPWGVSESGYNKTDAQLNYQYRAFGVPGLGFKRGLADDLVVAPYASAMGLMVNPTASCANLRSLAKQGFSSGYGFYEAIDYTTARLPPGQDSVVVKSYMAHHQGMALLSLVYLLCDRPMQRRFQSDPAFQATDLLLQERVPKATAVFPHLAEVAASRGPVAENKPNLRFFNTWNTDAPEVHLLSNGQYHVAVTNAGGGSSRWRELSVTRWREDPTRDHWGTFCYVRDLQSGAFWSAAYQPTQKVPSSYEVIFSEGRAEYRRRDGDLETFMEISISPEDDIELRRISVTNRGTTPRRVELTSYAEVVLAMAAADTAHPAFSNLFVQTELLTERQAILCTRRPRSGGERPPWMMHSMTVHGTGAGGTSFETSRMKFIGRGRTVADPLAMHQPALGNSEGSVLDPMVAIRNVVVVQPDETSHVHMVTGMSETREGALALVEKYQDRHLADRVFELSWTQSQVVLRRLDVTEADTQLFGRLASNVLYANASMRAPASVITRNRSGQSGLWGYGISGDLPIVLLRVADLSGVPLVKQLVQAHVYWRLKGLVTDLVIWNDDQSGYRQELHDAIINVIGSSADANLLDKRGGIFVRRTDQMSDDDKLVMQTVARVIVADTGGTLANQMDRRARSDLRVAPLIATRKRRAELGEASKALAAPTKDLFAFNGVGGFSPNGREYVITTGPGQVTPTPWVNVIANPWFGTVVSETGAAYTWCENAHSYRLSPWHNDPVSDPSGECFYLRDEDEGRMWSPTPHPAPAPVPYVTRHGFGYSSFACDEGGIESTLTTFVATDAPVKFVVVKVANRSGRPRRLSVMSFVELVMGAERAANLPHLVTEVDPKSGALFARNAYSSDFAPRVAFMASSEPARSVTGDRLEFLGRAGVHAAPACMARSHLSGRVGAGLDACFAMQLTLDLADGQEREIAFLFGSGRDVTDARTLVTRFRGTGAAHAALALVTTYWQTTLGAVSIQTPDVAVNVLANGWLLYQVLAARLWARSGFYQSGGAFGFRDQLQDSLALVHAQPALLRSQILRCAEHQFREGDVQHWWHPPLGRGVRTHISDDYLWLPFAVCRYIKAVGDTGVLEERAAFLEGRMVKLDEDSYYDLPSRSDDLGTVYEHCVRAIRHGLRMGGHGLPLMGSGDWNDGMNLVGEHGKGESVWLAFFLFDVLQSFAPVAQRHGDQAFAQLCVAEAAKLKENIEQHAWDGAWYLRAFFDDGQPMGSASSVECQIDSLPQSWSIISGAGQPQRVQQALAALDARLVDRPLGLIKLFDPAFDTSAQNPGYVKGYVPGVRENGGQYTHAAVWAVMAFAAAGDAEKAWELFGLINPVNHGNSEQAVSVYKVEPYVVAADVYTNPQHAGRGGWTWYTGSAGWMYQLVIESLLGLHLEVTHLRLAPLLPKAWPSVEVRYRYRNTAYHIKMRRRSGGNTLTRVVCDGVEQPQKTVPLVDDGGNHEVQVDLG